MKQLLQNLKTGDVEVADVPMPGSRPGHLLIRTSASLLSAGTERMLVEFGRAGWIDKARQQPDKVRMVLEKMRTDGVMAAVDTVQSKLDQPLPLGYCNVGVVTEVGSGVKGFTVGDRVASNGRHAEVVCVPKNLCARVPDGVSDEQAAFTVLGAIGLQGIRLASPTLGECVAVTGLGLIGLLTVQMLRAHGCRVLGIDPDPDRLALARTFGAETVSPASEAGLLAAAAAFSRGGGVDAVIITASTKSSDPVSQAAKMCRKRGRIVLVGVTGLELSRADFYEKELSFQVSCSYGPGRYDPAYEEGGHDYPLGLVRWTEQRNFEAVLELTAAGQLQLEPLVSHRFPIERASEAYALLTSGQPSMGIVLAYPKAPETASPVWDRRSVDTSAAPASPSPASVAFLGAGNYAGRVLIPAFKSAGAGLHTVVSANGVTAHHAGRKFGFAQSSTDAAAAVGHAAVDTVVVATRHNLHAAQVLDALRAGKHVFCEKPLCLTLDELADIEAETAKRPGQLLTVGFNRRFAPHTIKAKELVSAIAEPRHFVMTVNAGAIPPGHWTQDKSIGGGRIVGEACHFVDLLRHLAGAPITRVEAVALGRHPAQQVTDDKATLTLEFADGSLGVIHYLANGARSFPKERLEIFCAGKVLQFDNFRTLRGWGWKGFSKQGLWRQDKGQAACAAAFVNAVKHGLPAPIPRAEIFEVSRAAIELQAALRG